MKQKTASYIGRLIAILITAIFVCGCNCSQSKKQKLIHMEYDQTMNFESYSLSDIISKNDLNSVPISISAKNGTWLLYHICSLRPAKDVDFTFDVEKFYVVGENGKKYYARDLKQGDLESNDPGIYWSALNGYFRNEVQTAPKQPLVIKAGTDDMLALSWRFAVLVSDLSDVDSKKDRFSLVYDNSGGDTVLLTHSGHDPSFFLSANKQNLTIQCRATIGP